MGALGPGYVTSNPPSYFGISSDNFSQSTLWAGLSGELEVSSVTSFQQDGFYFSTLVKLRNIGPSSLSNVYCEFLYDIYSFDCIVLFYFFLF